MTWGESHGKAIGVVIDGCPAGMEIDEDEINAALALRAPGSNPYTSPRLELDRAEILSGVFEGKTTGAPISIVIANKNADSSKYDPIKHLIRPGHANFTYLEKYGIFDYRGGGRASGRETACRVAAGAVAKKLLQLSGIEVIAYIKQIGEIEASVEHVERSSILQNTLFCPDAEATTSMTALIEKTKTEGDSLGGVVEFVITGAPAGLGDPVYEKLEAKLALAMMGLPATRGFEIGSGFQATFMEGSEHNATKEGILAGISTGNVITGRVAFKPPSSIMKPQETTTITGEKAVFQLPEGSRHDPCVAIRAVPVVEAMAALVLTDALLLNRCAKL